MGAVGNRWEQWIEMGAVECRWEQWETDGSSGIEMGGVAVVWCREVLTDQCTYIRTYIYTHVCEYLHTYVHAYVCICTYAPYVQYVCSNSQSRMKNIGLHF